MYILRLLTNQIPVTKLKKKGRSLKEGPFKTLANSNWNVLLVHFFISQSLKSLGGDCLASLISVAFQNHVISWSSCWSFLLMEITVVFHKLLFFTELNWAEKHRLGTEPTHFSTRFLNMFCYFLEISVFNKVL